MGASSSVMLQRYINTLGLNSIDIEEYINARKITDTTERKNVEANFSRLCDKLLDYCDDSDLVISVNYYMGYIDKLTIYQSKTISEETKEDLLHNLNKAYLVLLTQKKYEDYRSVFNTTKRHEVYITQCEKLIDSIQYPEKNNFVTLIEDKSALYTHWGIRFGRFIADQTLGGVQWLNDKRLYWVWAEAMLKTIISALPADFYNISRPDEAFKKTDPYTGALSFGVYYFRFGVHSFLLLKGTLRGPWLTAEEKDQWFYTRFLTQLDARKFALLNDSFWGIANMCCYFWLNAKTGLGPWGDAATLALLCFDIGMTVWAFAEQQIKYEREIGDSKEQIATLDGKIKLLIQKKLSLTTDNDDEEQKKAAKADHNKLTELQLQLHRQERKKMQCERNWVHTKISLINNVAYAVGLMVAFAILISPLLPVSGGAIIALSVLGAVMLFAFSVIYKTIDAGLDIYKTHTTNQEADIEWRTLCSLFNDYKDGGTLGLKDDELKILTYTKDELMSKNLVEQRKAVEEKYKNIENEKKLLFLEIRKAEATTVEQKQLIVYKMLYLVRQIFIESATPAIIFASFVFMPLGIGIAVLATALALAITSSLLLEGAFFAYQKLQPKKLEAPQFDLALEKQEYSKFCDQMSEWKFDSKKGLTTFERHTKEEENLLKDFEGNENPDFNVL
jgi:hypothetical protein